MNVLVGLLPGLVIGFAQLHVQLMDLALHQCFLIDGRDVDLVDLHSEILELLGDLAEPEVGLLLLDELVSHPLLLGLLLGPLLLLPFELHFNLLDPMLRVFQELVLQPLE